MKRKRKRKNNYFSKKKPFWKKSPCVLQKQKHMKKKEKPNPLKKRQPISFGRGGTIPFDKKHSNLLEKAIFLESENNFF